MGLAGLRRIAPAAARHVHTITGKGIVYTLWSAELLAEALQQGHPQAYDHLWQDRYGCELMTGSATLSSLVLVGRAYEIVFQLMMTVAVSRSKSRDLEIPTCKSTTQGINLTQEARVDDLEKE